MVKTNLIIQPKPDCHGITVGHEEKEEEGVEQEVESDGEKTLKERCACPWMG